VKGFEKNCIICIHKKLGGQKNFRQTETKILKNKGPRMKPWGIPERMASVEEKRRKELCMWTCCGLKGAD